MVDGYVGLTMAQAMRRCGSKVTLVDRNGRLMHREDDDLTEEPTVLQHIATLGRSTVVRDTDARTFMLPIGSRGDQRQANILRAGQMECVGSSSQVFDFKTWA